MFYPENPHPAPWRAFYAATPPHLDYPDGSIYDSVAARAASDPDLVAVEYMNKKWSYADLMRKIDATARAFAALGVKRGERVLLCLPNLPQTVFCVYALARLGAVASLMHPLSAEGELRRAIEILGCTRAVVYDGAYAALRAASNSTSLTTIVATTPTDELPFPIQLVYKLKSKYKTSEAITWHHFLKNGENFNLPAPIGSADDEALVLFSGGTTGEPKGVRISNLSLNASALQTAAMCGRPIKGRSMLAALPMFHGFGLGVCVHTMLAAGARSILLPRVVLKEYASVLKRKKPNLLAGVPTLFEGIMSNPYLKNADFSNLIGVFSGGDSLSESQRERFDAFLKSHGSSVGVREGYGLTECLSASCLTPHDGGRPGSIGVPFPDMYYKICRPGSTDELAPGEQGEICIAGPTLMLGYIDRPDETAATLRRHPDGSTWLHTGDLGRIDTDGFVYFTQRLKRMIVTSGYNVYPSQIEAALAKHPSVKQACVIGVPDKYRMERVKAFVVLREGFSPSDELRDEILALCRREVARYALPRELEFRDALPTTGVGKIAYGELLKQELARAGEQPR